MHTRKRDRYSRQILAVHSLKIHSPKIFHTKLLHRVENRNTELFQIIRHFVKIIVI